MVHTECCVPDCNSNSTNIEFKKVKWHTFPTGERLKQMWLAATRLTQGYGHYYDNTKDLRICSLHFKPSDFVDCDSTKRKVAAVPSRFPWLNLGVQLAISRQDEKVRKSLKDNTPQCASKSVTPKIVMMDDDEIEVIKEFPKRPLSNYTKTYLKFPSEPNSKKLCTNNFKDSKDSKFDSEFKFAKDANEKYFSIPCDFNVIWKQALDEFSYNHIIMKQEKDLRDKLNQAKATLKNYEANKLKAENQVRKTNYLVSTPVKIPKGTNGVAPLFHSKPLNGISIGHIGGLTSIAVPANVKPQPGPDTLEIVSEISNKSERNLPLAGPITRSPLVIGAKVLAMKSNLYGVWVKTTVVAMKDNPEKLYKVNFDNCRTQTTSKSCSGKQLAYDKPCDVKLPVGSRIVARYKPESSTGRFSLYAGIIAEPPKSTNRFRYLVFFDDGFAQYTDHGDIHLVCEASKDVWEDVHPKARDFTKSYLQQYPERPMLKLQKNQVIKTEFEGGWWFAKVLEVDASMVKMYFEADARTEWIYRGSTRLGLLFNELAKAEASRLSGKTRRHNITARKTNENQPYVEYTRSIDEIILDSDESDNESKPEKPQAPQGVRRNVARKSTCQPKKDLGVKSADDPSVAPDVKSHLGYKEIHKLNSFSRIRYRSHSCNTACKRDDNPVKHKGKNPLLIPMFLGWERQIKKHCRSSAKLVVHYRSPCGRLLRNIEEVQEYLFRIKSQVTIDFFTFDCTLLPFRTFRPKELFWETKDIAEGKENVPVSCVNSLANEKPPYVEYASQRFPGKGVTLNLDPNFLCGCDCTDNCQDPSKCQCQQLTLRAYHKDAAVTDIGYNFRRLKEPLITGLYECNSRCHCSSSCTNRVVQNGLQVRLQMFKTEKKGWGIRCLDDVDAGMFLCIYAGQLLTEQGADEDGHQFGDEYLAELDHIEVVEKQKEDYESDVPNDWEDDVKTKEETDSKENITDESDQESTKSNSSLNNVSSDSEYESLLQTTAKSNYITRSRNRKKYSNTKFPSLPASPNTELIISESEDSSSYHGSSENSRTGKINTLSKELPDLDILSIQQTIKLRPLPPHISEAVDNHQFTRKAVAYKSSDPGLKSVKKKLQSLVKHPLPPPTPLEDRKPKFLSIRTYFKEDYCFIMDAKSKGNIGRYLNHSCHPNVFVQNVFVDTHDLRFPTVAFFSMHRIDAGTELTWDYNYEVGSVQDKVLYCHCETRKCRGRLL